MKIFLSLFFFFLTAPSFLWSDVRGDALEENSHAAVILMYHRFGESRYPSTNIRLEQFEQHLEYLAKNDYVVWPLSKIVSYRIEGRKMPSKTVALTIDDAFESIYTEAYPRLKEKNFPFTVFVNTSAIGRTSKHYMNWEQMREMRLHGAEFANHSLTHDVLLPKKSENTEAWQKRLKNEIEGAQKKLQEELGANTNENPKLFSYPFGEYSEQTADFVKSLGYVGISQTSGALGMWNDFRALPRFAMSEAYANPEGFILKLNALALPLQSVSAFEPIIAETNPPKLRLKLEKPMKNMGCYSSSGKALKMSWISKTEVEIEAYVPLKAPRDRYTCTAPAKEGRWYWYSHLWIVD
ncbi:polysaccharide deacetylase family protein [bacterium]|nr:polysaccharide deacetylase family protein [bacterium]MBU1995036.1 polysaccharide deacetylase family protein [bacterium]